MTTDNPLVGGLSAAELRTALEQLGISQARLARLLKVNKGTVNRWVLGDVEIPGYLHVLMFILLHTDLTIDVVEEIMESQP